MTKYVRFLLTGVVPILFAFGCATQPEAPARATAEPEPAQPVAEFGESWTGTTVETDVEEAEIDETVARVGFECVWTDGQGAGVAYPQEFEDVESGESVELTFEWDSGGTIAPGVYDARVELDNYDARVELDNVVGEGWIRDLTLDGGVATSVTVDLNAAQLAIPLDEVRSVKVYPAGTYDDYEDRNMLDSVPEDLELARYDEYHRDAIAPSGVFDLEITYTDETVEWLTGYEIPANARVVEL